MSEMPRPTTPPIMTNATPPPNLDPRVKAYVDQRLDEYWSLLMSAAEQAHPYVEDESLVAQPTFGPFTPIQRGDRLDLNISTPMLVEDVIPREGVALMYAEPETGKTPVALDLALCVANGLDSWAGQAICADGPQDVLFIAYEGGASVREYLRGWLREHPGCNLRKFWLLEDWVDPISGYIEVIPPLVEKVYDDDTRTWRYGAPFVGDLTRWIRGRFAPALVIVDTQVDALGALDENNAPDTLALYSELRRWSAAFGHVTMFLHHTSKSGDGAKSYRGSTALAGKADSMILLEKWKSQGRGAGKLSFTKSKGMRGAPGKRNYTGLRNERGDDYCVSWQPVSVSDLADSPEAEAEERRTRTIKAIWVTLHDAVSIDLPTGLPKNTPFSGAGVAHAMRELATREVDAVDVIYSPQAVRNLLDEMNTEGFVQNLADSTKNGSAAQWIAGRKPFGGGEDQ